MNDIAQRRSLDEKNVRHLSQQSYQALSIAIGSAPTRPQNNRPFTALLYVSHQNT
jgi:hypothetical protein